MESTCLMSRGAMTALCRVDLPELPAVAWCRDDADDAESQGLAASLSLAALTSHALPLTSTLHAPKKRKGCASSMQPAWRDVNSPSLGPYRLCPRYLL